MELRSKRSPNTALSPHRFDGVQNRLNVVFLLMQRRDFVFEIQKLFDGNFRRSHRTFNRKNDFIRNFDVLPDTGEVLGTFGYDLRPVRFFSGHELTGDGRQQRRDANGGLNNRWCFLPEAQMKTQLFQNFPSAAVAHFFLHEIADAIRRQTITPADKSIFGLIDEIGLIR